MKILNEVVKAIEICENDNDSCSGCPYANDYGEAGCYNKDNDDALYMIKIIGFLIGFMKLIVKGLFRKFIERI